MAGRRRLRFGWRRRRGIGPQHAHRVGARLVADTRQRCAVAALHDDVAGPELVLAVVESEDDAAVDHDHEVERVGGVHARPVRVVAVDADPVAATLLAREADDAHGAATGRRLEAHRAVGFVAAVVDGRGRAVEPQPRGDAEAVRPDGALRRAVRDDHRLTVGVVAGDDASCRELHGVGPYATGCPSARVLGHVSRRSAPVG